MVYVVVVAAAVLVAFALGGRPQALAALELRGIPLLFAAVGIQIVAFPPGFLPWSTGEEAARWLWLASYACLLCAAVLNLHLRGLALVAGGMLANLTAIVANGGLMPTLPDAARQAGTSLAGVNHNSITTARPRLDWLVDRWAAPDWVPLANVYSVGDVVLALGALVLVLAATDVPLLRRLPATRIALR